MYLRILALLTTIIFIILIILGFIYKIPIAYVPENSSGFEFIISHVLFIIIETFIVLALFLHMITVADIEFDWESLKEMFKPKV